MPRATKPFHQYNLLNMQNVLNVMEMDALQQIQSHATNHEWLTADDSNRCQSNEDAHGFGQTPPYVSQCQPSHFNGGCSALTFQSCCLVHLGAVLYVNDKIILIAGSNVNVLHSKPNKNISNLSLGHKDNELLLNLSKTMPVTFENHDTATNICAHRLKMKGSLLTLSASTKSHGFLIYQHLMFKHHAPYVSKEVHYSFYLIRS